ncbi:MBL fold metallo-hydrolase [Alkalicoccus daliensis]|uniref:Glyoxylase, beta-lactamase superfamily II n=1 Tax=Alkalicoccus daliensis TaxID=745820 RepID=A0A1H0CRT6_9BACI|nr:MBL fold metallo-hydrolase [Alkalicoccus daliensis]SDN60612.1 Glyoxylase, beta-lactamase superfamily II [Alkalicoccus daliensis]
MQVKQVSENVWKLSVWMGITISVWLVKEEDGVTLVDCGIPSMGTGILKEIEALELGPLHRILLTHGHSDHTGALEKLRTEASVTVFAHEKEIPYMEGKKPYPGRSKATAVAKRGTVKPLKEESDTFTAVGSLQPYYTPGHSPGHMVYYHEQDNVLIGGDLFTSFKNEKLRRPIPMFTANMGEAIKSGAIVKQLEPEILSLCHGTEIPKPHTQYDEYKEKWLS